MRHWLKALVLAIAMLVPSMGKAQAPGFYTDNAWSTFPLVGQGGLTVMVPQPNAGVRVCGVPAVGSPCINTADGNVFDQSGNPIVVSGGNFGQLTADNTGRFIFGCNPGSYTLQIAQHFTNTVFTQYLVTCSLITASINPNPTFTSVNSVNGYIVGGTATLNSYLKGNGTDYVSSNGPASGTGTPTACTNQFVTAFTLNADSAPSSTCTTDVLASAQHANQGTTTTVLHGNAAGNPSFGSVSLTADVSGTLGASNGGTGVSGTAVFPSSGNVTTDANTQTFTNKTFDTTGTGNVFKVNGTTVTGATGTPGAFVLSVSPTISSPAITGTDSGTETLQNKRVSPRVVTLSTSTTFTPDGDNSDVTKMNMTGATGTLTIAAPSGTPTDGQKLVLEIKTTNAQTYSFNATYRFSTSVTAPTTTGAGKTDYLGCIWNATDSKWDVVAVDQGH